MQEILREIRSADSLQMEHILRAVVSRMDALYPDDECMLLMLPANDPEQRKRILRKAEEICAGK